MSIPVELHEVRAVAAEKAGFAYLLTVGDSDRVHVIAVVPAIGEHEIVCEAGKSSRANAAARADVSLLWPPGAPGDYSLIVDGVATVDGSVVRIVPARAVQHRPAVGGGNDCAPVALD
ncbi:MAG TPA: pyridoxamine 5'-phosphate oxidase family protein [Acidimicrobiia bacterium]|nr:pyridoxamine 5'-phosphate oxidase family protein [Acidimicrobiia bacterium]